MDDGVLKVATCQFAVSDSVRQNSQQIQLYMNRARTLGAQIVHFSEAALSGYAGEEIFSFEKFGWSELEKQTQNIMNLAKQLGLWVVVGSTHRLTAPNKPHNCVYVINPDGQIADRYDKRFLTPRDLQYYTAGDHFISFDINNVRCSALICFDLRFPELYRELLKMKVDFVLQSFYNARQEGPSIHTHIMRQTMQSRAADNYFWASMSNSCRYCAPYPSCFIQPDGKIAKQLRQNTPGIMLNEVDLRKEFYDPMIDFREQVLDGALNNGTIAGDDPRSIQRNII